MSVKGQGWVQAVLEVVRLMEWFMSCVCALTAVQCTAGVWFSNFNVFLGMQE